MGEETRAESCNGLWVLLKKTHKFNMSNLSISTPLKETLSSSLYLQISTISQALIFVTRSWGWSFTERPGLLLVVAFVIAQLVEGASHSQRQGGVFCKAEGFRY